MIDALNRTIRGTDYLATGYAWLDYGTAMIFGARPHWWHRAEAAGVRPMDGQQAKPSCGARSKEVRGKY